MANYNFNFNYEDDHVKAIFKRTQSTLEKAHEAIKQVPELKGWYPMITIQTLNRTMDRMRVHVMICPPDFIRDEQKVRVMFVGNDLLDEPGQSMEGMVKQFRESLEYVRRG